MNPTLQAKQLLTKHDILASMVVRNMRRRVMKGCECPEPPKVEKVVQEKSCEPCIFEQWKPKPRKCIEAELKTKKIEMPPKCFPGMVIERPFSDCKQAEIDPFQKKPCKSPPKQPRPAAPIPPPDQIKVPASDWNSDC